MEIDKPPFITQFEQFTPGQKLGFAGSTLAITGSFLPWLHADILDFQFTIHGIDKTGKYTLGLALLASLLLYLQWTDTGQLVTAAAGSLITIIGLLHILDPRISLATAVTRTAVTTGPGAYFTAAGGLCILYSAAHDYYDSEGDPSTPITTLRPTTHTPDTDTDTEETSSTTPDDDTSTPETDTSESATHD